MHEGLGEVVACQFCDTGKIANPFRAVRGRSTGVECLIFEPLGPVTPGHVLVVPRAHAESAKDDPAAAAGAMEVAAWYANRHESANIITSIGAAATQTVKHLHVHVVPREAGDGLHLPWTKPVSEGR